MDITQIENNLETLLRSYTEDSFIYGLLSAYGIANASVSRLKKGDYNLSKNAGEVLWKKKVFFKKETNTDLHSAIDQLSKTPAITKQHPRFIIVTDFKTLLALDTDNTDTLDIPFKDLTRHFDFFLPWAGMEKSQLQSENPADIKAAERMGRLYDLILEENPIEDENQRHSLNVFFTRLLFCYFAEDTGIFPPGIFVNGVASHTAEDGSDLQTYLTKLFRVLNTQDRKSCPNFLVEYPYVNGGLFATESPTPRFNSKARKILIDCGALNWKAINPDIFGSMMQAVVHTTERSGRGMHYTSVANILKVIEPLFLDELRKELELAGNDKQKLKKLLDRIYHLRIFDPACGSGNFLIIAYKELCKIEIDIFRKIDRGQMSFRFESKLKLNQFFGIEIDDCAREIAKLSLWLAEHQMNIFFKEIFGETRPTLPLKDGGMVFCGNANRQSWLTICPPSDDCEIYIIGNPPYVAAKNQNEEQKKDVEFAFDASKKYKNIDYIAAWFANAAKYVAASARTKVAFVSTNSICQGMQASLLWPYVFKNNLEIGFAYKKVNWSNNAKRNAGVTCSIISIRRKSEEPKFLFDESVKRQVKNINAYLCNNRNTIVRKHSNPISQLPILQNGNQPYDGGHLIFTSEEKEKFIQVAPESTRFFKKLIGSNEFIKGTFRWCLWIEDRDLEAATNIPLIKERIERVRKSREKGGMCARSCADRPHQFRWVNRANKIQIVIPLVSSENRKYIPIGFLDRDSIVSNLVQVIYDPEPYIFGLVCSLMHMTWVKTISGRIRTDFRYTANVCYNGFPVPPLTAKLQEELSQLSMRVLDVRENYPEKSLGQLYAHAKMPKDLVEAHADLDLFVDRLYQSRPFEDDSARMECLFDLYEKMTKTRKKDDQQCQISLM